MGHTDTLLLTSGAIDLDFVRVAFGVHPPAAQLPANTAAGGALLALVLALVGWIVLRRRGVLADRAA